MLTLQINLPVQNANTMFKMLTLQVNLHVQDAHITNKPYKKTCLYEMLIFANQ